jgi:hypothetical protein
MKTSGPITQNVVALANRCLGFMDSSFSLKKNLNKKFTKNHINIKFIQHLAVEKVTGFFRGYVIFK